MRGAAHRMCGDAGQAGCGHDVQMQRRGGFFEIAGGDAAHDPCAGGVRLAIGRHVGICRSDGGVIKLIAQCDERWVGVVLDEECVAGERGAAGWRRWIGYRRASVL